MNLVSIPLISGGTLAVQRTNVLTIEVTAAADHKTGNRPAGTPTDAAARLQIAFIDGSLRTYFSPAIPAVVVAALTI